MEKLVEDIDNVHKIPKRKHICNIINYARAKGRPRHPTSTEFTLDLDSIPENFLVDDIKTDNGQHHIILNTQYQRELLKNSPKWFLDGTFKLVKKPMMQLFSVRVFVRGIDGAIKQVTVAYVLMSRRQISDYVKIFRAIIRMCNGVEVTHVMLDFESAAWTEFLKLKQI